ncbi:MAG: DNA internalization-related competence protein ComEC/Rec2 [Clostridiales bacterium]|jgi:competence protein ComEC|nr:DNA internalization-related competence protein ComEC/Rec2 [Clostridiales bacterium]
MLTALPLVSAAFIAGIALARVTALSLPWQLLLAVLAVSVALFLFVRKQSALIPILIVFIMLGMFSLRTAERFIHAPLAPYLGKEVSVTGHVHQVESVTVESASFLFRVESVSGPDYEGKPLHALLRIYLWRPPAEVSLRYGQRLQLSGLLSEPSGLTTPGGFDYASYLETQGVGAVMSPRGSDSIVLPGHGGSKLLRTAEFARIHIRNVLVRHLPGREASLAEGLLLGTWQQMPEETVSAYRTLGIAHLLAVSGLHVGFISAFIMFIVLRLFRGKETSAGLMLVLLFIGGYVILTGGRPPVWRAALMMCMALAARRLGRETEGLQGLAVATLLLLFVRPHWLFSLSFQFSFMATAGILFLAPRLQPLFSRFPFLAGPLAVTLAAQFAVLPLQVTRFSSIPLLALPVNLFCVPLVGVSMVLGMAGIIAGFIAVPLAAPFYLAALPLLTVLDIVPRVTAQLPVAAITVFTVHPLFWALYFSLPAFLFPEVRRRITPLRSAIAVLLIFNMLIWWNVPGTAGGRLQVTFLDVGQGLSVFMQTPEGVSVLVDGGNGGSFNMGERVVIPFLRRNRTQSLDVMILTHPHEDHYGGLAAVVDRMPVKTFVSSGETEDSAAFTMLADALLRSSVHTTVIKAGDRIVLGDSVFIDVLSPPKRKFQYTVDDVNNNSLVLHVTYKDFTILITGDAEREALTWLVKEKPSMLQSSLLQVPHHGSRNALFPQFLETAGFKAAVIPVGKNNFGHPHQETLDLLARYGVAAFRTDEHGSVTVVSDGQSIQITPFKLQP